MTKSLILLFAFILSAGALVSFKEKYATSYGGSASVRINVVEVYSFPNASPKRTILSSPTLNATENCIYSSSSKAKEVLKQALELQAYSKVNNVNRSKAFTTYEYEFDGSIDYRIDSCN